MKKITRFRTVAAVAATVVGTGALIALPATGALASPPPAECKLTTNHPLTSGKTLCAGHQYTLVMQTDGNVVEYGNGRALWQTYTSGFPGAALGIQLDRNLVVRSAAGKAIWQTGTGTGTTNIGTFSVGADGNLAISSNIGKIVWQNGAPGSNSFTGGGSAFAVGHFLHAGSAKVTLQADGNLVARLKDKTVWSSKTAGTGADAATLQKDGNFVLRSTKTGKAVWSTGTAGTGASNAFTITPTGAVTLTKGSAVLWKAP